MATLLLQLIAPMQSWGSRSRFDDRDTEREPTKSGVLGLVASALGRPRSADVSDLSALMFGVRVDRAGQVRTDYHTAQEGNGTAVTRRHYLADAAFLIGLEGAPELLGQIDMALRTPFWPPFLGRKSFPPSQPMFVEGGVQEGSLLDVLTAYPVIHPSPDTQARFVLELRPGERTSHATSFRMDQPTGTFAERRYTSRQVKSWTASRTQENP
ncbi:type I-E CRISPR-associated protein Cas5/CasD [Deinococcus ruber]|uniref:Type I-E CRISPR-associated protein Cas5/CasD n=1 Tax=Deinococcus ruber TaxID=1848197 RepID=A0A918F8V6_9DEIO|nr:type I-E CRISPR-associated protein Cas5/CasD [Deinococcus ruber]GGR11463.1 type I-E CRISPR-associated protein Cas5/CasD [Deinococcus ruber]